MIKVIIDFVMCSSSKTLSKTNKGFFSAIVLYSILNSKPTLLNHSTKSSIVSEAQIDFVISFNDRKNACSLSIAI